MRSTKLTGIIGFINKFNGLNTSANKSSRAQSPLCKAVLADSLISVKNCRRIQALAETSHYLFCKKSLGHTVSAETSQALLRANLSMEQTRQMLPLGPANIRGAKPDLWGIGLACSALWQKLPNRGLFQEVVAVNSLFGTGHCFEHAVISAFNHHQQLKDSERISIVENQDHMWTEVKSPQAETIVIDTWAKGPAILAEDHMSKAQQRDSTDVEIRSYEQVQSQILENQKYIQAEITPAEFNQMVKQQLRLFPKKETYLFDNEPPSDKAFRAEVLKATKHISPAQKFLQKVTICQELGASEKDSIAAANQTPKETDN